MMKKAYSLLLSFVMLFILSACSTDAITSEKSSPTIATTTDSTTAATDTVAEKLTTLKSTTESTTVTTTTNNSESKVATKSSKKVTTASTTKKINPTGLSWGPKLILNGKELDVYTSHYFIRESYAEIPLDAFLLSIGAEYADSPASTYDIECFEFMGKRYIASGKYHLFMLENDYQEFLGKVKTLTKDNTRTVGLLPRYKNICYQNKSNTEVEWGQIWIDHVSLMNALRKSGIDITIECDYTKETILVTLPKAKK